MSRVRRRLEALPGAICRVTLALAVVLMACRVPEVRSSAQVPLSSTDGTGGSDGTDTFDERRALRWGYFPDGQLKEHVFGPDTGPLGGEGRTQLTYTESGQPKTALLGVGVTKDEENRMRVSSWEIERYLEIF